MLPADTPRLSKWPFLLGDAVLLALAWLIADQSKSPFSGQPLIWIVVCVVLAAVLGAVPFLADYARRQDEALDERQRALESLSRTVAASAEQIGIAAHGLHELAELAQRNAKAASQLGPGLQEKVAELKAQLAATRDDEREKLARELAALRADATSRLEAAAARLERTVAELNRADAARQNHAATEATPAATAPESPPAEPAKPEPRRIRKPAAPFEASAPAANVPPAAVAEVAPVVEPPPIPAETIPEVAPIAPSDSASPVPVRKRAPRKPRAEAPAEIVPAANPGELGLDAASETPPASAGTAEPEETRRPVEQARSSDGATRLLVTAYIGIGNRLFIRGDGPGLGWDKGVPLQFVSIGKWRWETPDAATPVKYKLFKNDVHECTALGAQTVDPGQQQEVTAAF